MEKEIKKLLGSELRVGTTAVPVAHIRYHGNQKTFIVWTIINEPPQFGADDKLMYTSVEVDIDVYSNKNYKKITDEILEIFLGADWSYVETGPEMFEEETNLYHRTITFAKEKYFDGRNRA